MKRIKKLIEKIDEEIEGAKYYAEKYVDAKVRGNMNYANKFNEMAKQELQHAMTMHDYTVMEIEEVRKVYVPSQQMLDAWEHEHKEYIEEVAKVKQMISM